MDFEKGDSKKYTDFTPDDIKKYLDNFRNYVLDGKYSISRTENRRENIEFIEDYKIDTRKEKEILLSIQYDDFCYAVGNNKEAFAHERLYIFCKLYELDQWGTLAIVEIYIKTNVIQTRRGEDFLIVVSFHEE